MLKDLEKQIDKEVLEIGNLLSKGDLNRAFLKEFTVNRLLHERNKLILDNLNKKIDKILKNDVNLSKINQKLDILTEKKTFWQKITTFFKK
jgi:hypothetical protein